MKRFKILTILLIAFLFSNSDVIFAQNQTQIQYLSGTDKDNMVDWDFYCSDGMQSGKWTKIGVPSCWEQQGFGGYNYGHDELNTDKVVHNEYGLYKYNFFVSKDWKNKEVKIVFEGVMTDAEVKVNGKLAGEIHQGAFYEFKYSISKLLKYGEENLLEVKVNKVSANASINAAERNADFWIFGGIYRPVYLQASPKENIKRLAIDAKADGKITADVFIDSKNGKDLSLTLFDLKGNKIQDVTIESIEKEKSKWTIKANASNVRSWNPEQPNLYSLQFNLLDKKGKTLHQVNQRIGFRTVEVLEADGIYVNGQKIKFKGVNRHSFHPYSGRTTSKALSIEHVKMMKDMNMNAVRMSHYPPDVHFLEACDSLGLFVIDEVCTWHTPHLDTKVGTKIVKETVVRDVNHPSILLWANGNESGWNLDLDDLYGKWDIQKREVIHPWGIFKKTNTYHYVTYNGLAYDGYSKDKISFPTELLHGLYDGGHGAGLDDYWKIMYPDPLSAGGFLWDFADEAIERTDKNGTLDSDGNHGSDGIVGPYGEKEASYFTVKEIWSPIYIQKRFIRNGFNGVFSIENRYHFTSLDACTMKAKWVKFDADGNVKENVLAESVVKFPALEPEQHGKLKVDLPTNWKNADVLYLIATDHTGMEIFTWSYPVKLPKELNKNILSEVGKGQIKTKINDSEISISTADLDLVFSAKTGLIQKVVKNGKIIPLSKGPIILNQKQKIDTIWVTKSKGKVEISTLFLEPKKKGSRTHNLQEGGDKLTWTVNANGRVDLQAKIKSEKSISAPRGITFSFPESEVAGMKWLGDGPYRVWRNRIKGTKFKVWENDYNNTITGESGFVYPEFKGFFSNLYWSEVRGKNQNGFKVYCHTNHTYLRMLTPDQPLAPKSGATVKKFPSGDISFVMNIPAIGTKFKQSEKLGPTSDKSVVIGRDDEPIVIDLTFEF